MTGRKLWYIMTLIAFALLPLSGCGGSGNAVKTTQKGTEVTVSGSVLGAKSSAKTAALVAGDMSSVTVYDALNGTALGTAAVDGSGKFTGLTFTLASAKTILVFKATVAQGTFRTVLPIDLSNPPAAGITASSTINVLISGDTTTMTEVVSTMLGLSGVLGDSGKTLASVGKTYSDALTQVQNNGGQTLAYNTSGLALTGQINASLLPAVDAGTLSVDDLNNIALGGQVVSAYIPGKKPIVNFTVTNKATGKGIKGLKTFALHVAKLVPEANGSNAYWLNYISKGLPLAAVPAFVNRGSSTPVAPSNPSADPSDLYVNGVKVADGYKVIDHGDGSYTVVFGADITQNTNVAYDGSLVHRIGISVRNVNVPGGYAGPVDPRTGAAQSVFTTPNVVNMFYDFTPATGLALVDTAGKRTYAHDLVTSAACEQCHYKTGITVPNNYLSGHTGSRVDTKLCVMCHTSQVKSSTGPDGEGEFVTLIHRIHMGEELPVKTGMGDLVHYGEQTYPHDIRNCTTCHKGADVNNWKTKPSRKSCGSCHNNMDFAAHKGGQATDQNCAACHADASLVHVAMTPPNSAFDTWNGTTTIRSNAGYMAVEGSIAAADRYTYDVKEVKAVAVTGQTYKNPAITFKLKKNGTDVVFGDYSAANGIRSIMPGVVGSPGLYFAFAVPQDGASAPVDFNATASANLKNVYYTSLGKGNGSTPAVTSTFTGPDGTGYYTATLTAVRIAADATMLTGGIGYNYDYPANQPLTQMNVTGVPAYNLATKKGGLIVAPPNVAKAATGYTARRAIVSNAKCNACHIQLGVKPQFHVGQRNDAPTCAFCHNPNRANSGWSANGKDAFHALHAASKRFNKFSWETSAGISYWHVTFPGSNTSNRPTLRNCELCHLAGTYDFSASAYTANNGSIFDNMLFTTVASGTGATPADAIVTGNETVPGNYRSPHVAGSTVYGAGFSYSTSTGLSTPAAGTTLVISPISAACYACHDSALAKAHMTDNGGAIYEARSTALSKKETCLVCHGPAGNNLNSTVPSIKAVHRWW